MAHLRRLQLAAAAVLTVALTACSGSGGGSGPTAPQGPQAALATGRGTVTVYTNGIAFDATRADAAIEAAYAKARAQVGDRVDRISVDGMAIDLKPGTFDGAVGRYYPDRDQVDVAQGVENVLTHELQHRFCHKLGNSGDCCTYQDHAGGYDLQCRRQ